MPDTRMKLSFVSVLKAGEHGWGLSRGGEALLLLQDLMHMAVSHRANVFGITLACLDF